MREPEPETEVELLEQIILFDLIISQGKYSENGVVIALTTKKSEGLRVIKEKYERQLAQLKLITSLR